MSRPHAALVTIASGERYFRYARDMLASAEQFFLADCDVERSFHLIEGRHGWPEASMHRYHVLTENAARFAEATHVFMIDADMLFKGPVSEEVIGHLVATLHPGYIGRPGPFERRVESAACVAESITQPYFCGAFLGGDREAMMDLAQAVRAGVDVDANNAVLALWHDESHVNRYLSERPPTVALTPSYCYPEDDAVYLREVWQKQYQPLIVACKKTRGVQWSHWVTDRARRVLRPRGRGHR